MINFEFWRKWLLIALLLQALAGVAIALCGPQSILGPLYNHYLIALWGSSQIPTEALKFHQWIFGVLGATMASWAMALAIIIQHPFKKRELWAWNCVALSLAVWFPLDTALSIYHGVWPNAVFNLLALSMLALPLIFSRKNFLKS